MRPFPLSSCVGTLSNGAWLWRRNEPGTGPGYFWNRNFSQYLGMWSHAVTAARRVRPAVQVLGPSTSSFSLDFLRTFLSAANASNTMPNVLSWHEFSADGADIPSVVVPHARVAVPSLLLAIVAVVQG